MAAGSSSASQSRKKTHGNAFLWFQKKEQILLVTDIVCITLLFFLHLFTSTFQVFTTEVVSLVQILAIVFVVFIALSIVWKGILPLIICVLGIAMMYDSVLLPYYATPQPGEINLGGSKFTWTLYTPMAVSVAANMHFLLGASMVAFSIIIAYRPSLLFTRNRPESLDSEWSKFPVWYDNTLLANNLTERSIPIKNLMTDQDRYLLWRYEYVLAGISGTPHLVKPDGLVPKDSTRIFRDKDSGRVIGKARYTGFFM
jgi:hypothetical protein